MEVDFKEAESLNIIQEMRLDDIKASLNEELISHIAVPNYAYFASLNYSDRLNKCDIIDQLRELLMSIRTHGFKMCEDSANMLKVFMGMSDFDNLDDNIDQGVVMSAIEVLTTCLQSPEVSEKFIEESKYIELLKDKLINKNRKSGIYINILLSIVCKKNLAMKVLSEVPIEIFCSLASDENCIDSIIKILYWFMKAMKKIKDEHFDYFLRILDVLFVTICNSSALINKEINKLLIALDTFASKSSNYMFMIKFPAGPMIEKLVNLLRMNTEKLDDGNFLIEYVIKILIKFQWSPDIPIVDIGMISHYMKSEEQRISNVACEYMFELICNYVNGNVCIGDQLQELVIEKDFLAVLEYLLAEGDFNRKQYAIKILGKLMQMRIVVLDETYITDDFVLSIVDAACEIDEESQVVMAKIMFDVLDYAIKTGNKELYLSNISIDYLQEKIDEIKEATKSKEVLQLIDKFLELLNTITGVPDSD